MSDNTRRDVTSEDFDDLPEVPTYTGETGSTKVPTPPQDIYQRTGKAAPTEVFPASPTPAPAPAAAPAAVPFAGEPTEYLAPGEAGPLGEEVVAEPLARRGTTDFGLLLLRVLVGGYLILDALKVFFGLGGSAGIAGLEGEFAAYPYGEALAVVVPTLELAAGVFLVLGLLAPVAALVALAVTGFLLAHVVAASPAGANPFTWTRPCGWPCLCSPRASCCSSRAQASTAWTRDAAGPDAPWPARGSARRLASPPRA